MITLISEHNLRFTKPQCKCGLLSPVKNHKQIKNKKLLLTKKSLTKKSLTNRNKKKIHRTRKT